jgi:hypothetical protein
MSAMPRCCSSAERVGMAAGGKARTGYAGIPAAVFVLVTLL